MIEFARVCLVIALVAFAAVLATPPGRLPLALRGLRRIMRRDLGVAVPPEMRQVASTPRRIAAFLLIMAALAVILI